MSVTLNDRGKKNLRIVGILALVAAFFFSLKWYNARPKEAKASTEIGAVALPDAPEASMSTSTTKLALPSDALAANGGTKINWYAFPWTAQHALIYALGGGSTTKGSLFDVNKLQVHLTRQDDCNVSIAELVKFAKNLKENPNSVSEGVFATFMGDGNPAFAAQLEKELAPLGPDYQAIAFYPMGKSYGEDKLMAPPSWLQNPKNAIGKTVACVLRDGDMNILLKWAGDNGLKVNPDETTYDSSAINLIAAKDFLNAAEKYITGYTEPRRVVVNGKKLMDKVTVGTDAVATWTPGDVNIAENKGGLVVIASTKQYASQMPAVTVTIKKWAYDHMSDMQSVIIALAQAGDQVRNFNDAKEFAAKAAVKAYGDKTADYWLKYYNGVQTKDKQGLNVSLGGSVVFNLNDAAQMFGMGKDGLDRYKIVYNTFGDILSKMYPEVMKTYPAYDKFVDKTFMASVISNHPELLKGASISSKVEYSNEITSEVSSKNYAIQFNTGSATINPASYPILKEIMKSAVVGDGLALGIYGHTDNTGNDAANEELSMRRAEAVKAYLISLGLPEKQIANPKGYGSSKPVDEHADNNLEVNRAKNRRVQIVLGQ